MLRLLANGMPVRFAALIAASRALAFAPASATDYEAKPVEALLDQDIGYDPATPRPEAVTGFAIGEIIWTPAMHAEYARAVVASSDRMTIETVGRSTFGRPIHRVIITSPENHARIDAIRDTQRGLMRAGAAAPADHPAIIQPTFGVHGSEPSSYDSAALLLYHFAAGQGEAMDRLLDETVIILVIMI
ncbi:MAG: carboxypeptidase, partial [Oceanicaulis sp.]|nr:carboxypeptidase [Oceanicaulis sp.]